MEHHIVLSIVARILIPMIMIFALYVQFHGDYGPGGGFQAGVIFAGESRDVDEAKGLGLPLFARAAVPLTARGRIIEESTNQRIEIGKVSLLPGDYIIADNSGIVVIPQDRVHDVVPEAENIVAREQAMAADVMAGKSVVEVMGINYEQMLT